ncbi:hypothetical protein HT031_002328 [Scenedesmus sp. PABB004]|nr:hypothetical protein HT031_002328 [Scenedesmus sp. PABB004]
MNRKLLDGASVQASVALPEVIEEYLEYGAAKCAAFNRRGTLLASARAARGAGGGNRRNRRAPRRAHSAERSRAAPTQPRRAPAAGTEDGFIVIWDFETRGVAKVLARSGGQDGAPAPRGAAPPAITSLAWSRSGRHLLSGSLDKHVTLWDILSGEQVCDVVVASGVARVCLSQRAPYRAAASLISTPPVLIDLGSGQVTPLASVELKPGKGGQQEASLNATATGVAHLTRSGGEVLLGQLRGVITVYDAATAQVLEVVKLPAAVKVMSLSSDRKGRLLLANCSDKVVRLFELRPRPPGAAPLSEEQLKAALAGVEASRTGPLLAADAGGALLSPSGTSFHNAVERNQWRGAALSSDTEHVAAGAAAKDEHRIYVWSRHLGKLEKILEGPRNESTADLTWHPARSLLVTVSGNGRVYLWAQVFAENWSAFAPEFKELEANEEYVEAEDDRPPLRVFSSDEEDEAAAGDDAPLHWLPAEVALGLEATRPGGGVEDDDEDGSGEASGDEGTPAAQDGGGEGSQGRRERKRRVRFEERQADAGRSARPPRPNNYMGAGAAGGPGGALNPQQQQSSGAG